MQRDWDIISQKELWKPIENFENGLIWVLILGLDALS